ncbi:MAG TPA: hypothetical protein VGG46_04180 [Terriglobales bacterium]|jgi:hypothetical protein
MNKENVIQVKTRKYFALLFFNAAKEFLESAKADFAARRYLTILASQRRFLEYSRRAVWLSYFATEEEVVYVQNNPDARDPKPFPELQEIDILMRQFVGMDGLSGLGLHVNDEGTTFMQLLHQFTHGDIRSIQTLNAGFKVDGVGKILEQNTRDLRSVGCYVIACNLDLPKKTLQFQLSAITSETEQKQLLAKLYQQFKAGIPDILS